MTSVKVRNTSDEDFEAGWDGVRYTFPVGKTVEIPYVAAAMIFGHHQEDKEPTLVRHGWIITHNDLPEGLKRLAKFKIEDDGTRHSLSPVVERVPLQSPKGAGGKLVQPAPL